MNREQFYHLLRASAEIVERQRAVRGIDVNEQPARIIVIGSQSILGSWSDEYLPDYTTRSAEMDVAFMPTAGDEYAFDLPRQELADLIEGYLGRKPVSVMHSRSMRRASTLIPPSCRRDGQTGLCDWRCPTSRHARKSTAWIPMTCVRRSSHGLRRRTACMSVP